MAKAESNMSDQRFSSLDSIKPLNQRVAAIRHEACKFGFYSQKYITVNDEIASAKKYLQNDVLGPVILLIQRAVFYTYMDYRSAASFVSFFHSLYYDVNTPVGQSQIKFWFLQAIRNQESRHYADDKERSGLQERARADRLIDMIQGILDDKLADDMDCATFFTSITLKTLAIIPCQARFDRRIKRLQTSPFFKNETYETAKITRLFILATMDLDNNNHNHDYATIPLDRLSEFEHLFRSNFDYNPDIVNIMLDLFMNEIAYNYTFWIQLIKRCQDLILATPLPLPLLLENTNDNQNLTIQTTFGHLLGLKFKRFYNATSPEKEGSLETLSYASALLIKENLVSIRQLVQYIDVNSNESGQQFLTALFSVGDLDTIVSIIRNCDNFPEMDKSFYSRIHLAVDIVMDSWLENTSIPTLPSLHLLTAAGATPQQQQQQKSPAKVNKTLVDGTQRTGYYFDSDSESDSDTEKEDHESNSISASTFSSVHSRKNGSELGSVDCVSSNIYDHFCKKIVYNNWKAHFSDNNISVKIQLLSKFIMPCFDILGFDRMINAPTTVNKFIVLLQSALTVKENDNRTPLLQMLTGFVFPVLAYDSSINVYNCIITTLTDTERLHYYLLWRDNDNISNTHVRQRRNNAKQDFKILLDHNESNYHPIEKTALELLHSHPTEIADCVIHEMQFNYDMTLDKRQFIGDLYTHSSSKLALDILAAQIADKIASSRSMIFDQKENKPRLHKLPESIDLLCVFARHLFKDRQVSSAPLYHYLSLYLNHQTLAPKQQNASLPWFFSASFIQFACAKANEYIYHLNNLKRKANHAGTTSPSKKRTFRPLGDSYNNNSKRCL